MVGSYMGRVFTVSSQRILTPSNLKGSAGSDWANHEIIGKKARSQWVGPKLKSYTMDILLRAQDGVSPRSTLDYFQRAAESQMVDWFIIGGRQRRVGHGTQRRRADRVPGEPEHRGIHIREGKP